MKQHGKELSEEKAGGEFLLKWIGSEKCPFQTSIF
jgi:hypothetical protein